jgi:hypothetical protein
MRSLNFGFHCQVLFILWIVIIPKPAQIGRQELMNHRLYKRPGTEEGVLRQKREDFDDRDASWAPVSWIPAYLP